MGYVATRWLGAGRGTAVTGITGGLVSSTAVTLSFARRSRDEPATAAALACGILLAWAIMFARVLVMALVHSTPRMLLAARYPVPCAAMGLVTVALAWFHYRASVEPTRPPIPRLATCRCATRSA